VSSTHPHTHTPTHPHTHTPTHPLTRLLVPSLILLVAFALRVWALEAVPPGLTHDEAAHLHDAKRIWEGYRPIYLTSAYGREPLYDYATAPLVGLLGMRVVTGRLASAMWGTALVGLLYAWVARAFDRPTAALAAALMALSFWPLSTSRQILRSVAMPTLLTAAVLLFWQAVYPAHPVRSVGAPLGGRFARLDFGEPLGLSVKGVTGRHQHSLFLLAGAVLGLSFYAYMPARATWLVPTLFGLGLALTDRPRWRRVRVGLGLMFLTMALVAAPLLVYLAAHPELEVRVEELTAPLQALWEGDAGPLWARIRETLPLFSHHGDVHWMYNIPGRPLLPPVLAALFYLGLLTVVYGALHRRRPAYVLLSLWLLLGVAPALVTGLESSALRAIAAQPAVFTIVALPPVALGRRLLLASRSSGWLQLGRWAQVGAISLTLMSLALLGLGTAHDYFQVWANYRDTRVAYHTHVIEIARYLKAQPPDIPITISTLYPGPLHDPYVTDVALGRADLKETIRWYDARFALLLPNADPSTSTATDADKLHPADELHPKALAIFPALAPLDAVLEPFFEPTARLLDRVELEPDDLVPWFEVYAWQPRVARASLPLTDPVDVGHIVAFVGYQLRTPSVAPGGTVELLTFWCVLDPSQFASHSTLLRELEIRNSQFVLFTHVLDAAGQIVGQQDRLDVPAWNWSPGDLFVQLHRFPIDADLAAGLYPLEIGVYTRAQDYPRLPVYDPESLSAVADHIPLPPIEVVVP
jgi:4-amino-4-deoxy-L-arabinose transferase-like glycosyltransferase